MDQSMIAALKEPFPKEAVGKLPKVTCKVCGDPKQKCTTHTRKYCKTCKGVISEAHMHVDFVGHAYVTARLWDVDPDWDWEPLAFNQFGLPAMDEYGGLWIRLTIGGKTKLGYGDADGRKGHNATKIAIGDALRNAAMRFQVALDMWKKDKTTDEKTPTVEQGAPADLTREQVVRQIILVGKGKGMSPAKVADEFTQWSEGKHDFDTVQDIDMLVRFRNDLQG